MTDDSRRNARCRLAARFVPLDAGFNVHSAQGRNGDVGCENNRKNRPENTRYFCSSLMSRLLSGKMITESLTAGTSSDKRATSFSGIDAILTPRDAPVNKYAISIYSKSGSNTKAFFKLNFFNSIISSYLSLSIYIHS